MSGKKKGEQVAYSIDLKPILKMAGDSSLDRHPKLRSLFEILIGIVKRKEEDLLPPDFTAESIASHLAEHFAAIGAREAAGKSVRSVVADRRKLKAEVESAVVRLKELVDGRYPPGDPARGAFFPGTSGAYSDVELLKSLLDGATRHSIGRYPAGTTHAELEALCTAANAAQIGRATAGSTQSAAASVSQSLGARTRHIRTRLIKVLYGYHGRTSKELADYGLKVRKSSGGAKRKKKEIPAPPAP